MKQWENRRPLRTIGRKAALLGREAGSIPTSEANYYNNYHTLTQRL